MELKQLEFDFSEKKRKFKISTWFIKQDLEHKVSISYENETKRAYDLLKIMLNKYWKIDGRKKFNNIEVTEEEYQTWYIYFLEYYIDEHSIFVGSKEEKESKRLLRAMKKFFGNSTFNMDHRAGSQLKFAKTMVDTMGGDNAINVIKLAQNKSTN
jgi:hypothetical protein|tara:strand:+ start:49 stop:513 length:465 start_codon:yes stop_codon:yes gene_type:complete